MSVTRSEVLKYLSDTRSHFAQYHNHKEASAWAAAAVYIAFLVQISTSVGGQLSCLMGRGLAVILVIVLGVAVCRYLRAQFRMRHYAANYIAACFELSAEYLRKDQTEFNPDTFALVDPSDKEDKDHHSPYILPKTILEKAKHFDTVGHGIRKRLECIIYIVIAVITLAALARLLSLA